MSKIYRVFIDESGYLGGAERYMVICCVVMDKKNWRKWGKISNQLLKDFNQKKARVLPLSEIKGSHLEYDEKAKVIDVVVSKIDFGVFLGVIDKQDQHYINTFSSDSRKKELAFNYLTEKIFKNIHASYTQGSWEVFSDERNIKTTGKQSLEDYLNTRSIDEQPDTVVKIHYRDSKNCKGVQLADIIANISFTNKEYNRNKHLYKKIASKIQGTCMYPESGSSI